MELEILLHQNFNLISENNTDQILFRLKYTRGFSMVYNIIWNGKITPWRVI